MAKPTEYFVTWPDQFIYNLKAQREGTTDIDMAEYWLEEDARTLQAAQKAAKRIAAGAVNGETIIKRRVNVFRDETGQWDWDTEQQVETTWGTGA